MGAPSKNIGNQLQSQNVHNLTYVSAAWFQMTDCNSGTASSETLKKLHLAQGNPSKCWVLKKNNTFWIELKLTLTTNWYHLKMCHLRHRLRFFLFSRKVVSCLLVQLINRNRGKNFQESFAQFGGLVLIPGLFELSNLLQLMNNQLC